MKSNSLAIHLLVALLVSFGVSAAAWKFLDLFHPTMFWIASGGAAVAGGLAGWFSGRLLATTLFVTLLMRGAVLFFAIDG